MLPVQALRIGLSDYQEKMSSMMKLQVKDLDMLPVQALRIGLSDYQEKISNMMKLQVKALDMSPIIQALRIGINDYQEKIGSLMQLQAKALDLNAVPSLLEKIIAIQENALLELNKLDCSITDRTIDTSEKTFNITEIQDEINSCLENSSFLSKEIECEKRIATFVRRIASQHPIISFIISTFLISIITGVCANIYYSKFISSSYQTQDKNLYIKIIQTQPKRMKIQNEILKNYRFVSADCLLVRESCSKKARVINKIYCGQLVEIIYKDKSWTLIKWRDEENVYKGWVFSRYLKKFKQ